MTLETGSADRRANMDAFAKRALELLYEAISAKSVKRTIPPLPPSRSAPRARNSSISVRPFGVSRCQKVQPLQASSPCASAPMRWIEPTVSPSDTAPSARTSALCRFLASTSSAPGVTSPRSISTENATRGASRAVTKGAIDGEGTTCDAGDALFRGLGVFRFALDADEAAAEALGHRAGGAGAVERVEHQIVRPRRRQDHARQQRFRLLGRMQLLAVGAFQPLLAGAEREGPVRAHLHVFVAGFQRLVIEGVALGVGVARGPDHGLVRIGEAAAAEIRHRIGLAPDHVVEDPEAEILHDRADAEDVVIGADHPDGAGRLQHAAAGGEPGFGEIVIGGEAGELVPVVGDRIDVRIVRALQIAGELEIVRRIGEHQIDGTRRQLRHLGDAVADQNAVLLESLKLHGAPVRAPRDATQP